MAQFKQVAHRETPGIPPTQSGPGNRQHQKYVTFYAFPKNPLLRKINGRHVLKMNRQTTKTIVFSKHFTTDDFLQFQKSNFKHIFSSVTRIFALGGLS